MTGAPLAEAARGAWLVAGKDLRAEARARTVAQGVGFFAALTVLLFSFALGPDSETLRRLAPGLLWLALTLASLLAVGRSFASEHDLGTLEPLLLYPVPRESLFLGKLAANLVLLLLAGGAALALMVVLYTLPAPVAIWPLTAGLLLGALGLAITGTFYGAVSASLKAREALVPMLLLPLLVPLLISTTEITDAAFKGTSAGGWLFLLTGFDIVTLLLALAVFPYALEE